ncbi:MAG: hypothetical protein BWX88_03169 [Planctomycetes bacterium ADurb.Bin126]|nr:MAG: hypothetical protein BWX88_03169 [Planctomycetes bacterium ADurb.Bin126]HOD82869.1 DUF4838 domain-containing protein [Phycisphaerae bacterium]HQL75289.1 DUF4838 domain-containing protein [Phycisphaerae bacterium]
MIARQSIAAAVAVLAGLFAMQERDSAAAPATAPSDDRPLVLTPQNTIILEGPGGSAELLQYCLLRYYVSVETAEPFQPGAKVDRSTAPAFAVLRESPKLVLPADKCILSLGPTRLLGQADRQRLAQSAGAILLKRAGRAILLAGQLDEAVSAFLDRVAGIRSYAPEEIWTSRPAEKQMTVGELDLFRPRVFATSWLAPYWPRNREWVRLNPSAGRLTISSNHNLANIFPPDKYGRSHPEIYELRGGQRRVPLSVGTRIWNPCLSAKVLPDLAMEYVRATMKQRPGTKYISMGMMDINFDCQCESCQASVRRHGGSYSNLYYTLLNEVARRCQGEFPGLLITSLLYSNARTPPVGMRIEPNIVVKVVTKTYRFVEPEALAGEQRRIRAFSDLGARWMIHDWCFSGVSPRNYMHQYAAFLQWAAQNGMIGAYVEYSPGESWYLDGAKYWILAQLLADPYQDVDLLWKQYCRDMFGPAGELMYRFHQHFQDKFVHAPEHIMLADVPRQEPALFSPDDLAYQRSLLEGAIRLTAGDELIQQRLAKVLRYFRAHELFAQATYLPNKLDRQFAGEGINKPLLAFYVNDDGSKLDEAIRYYHTRRTVAPDDNYMEVRLGMPVSYVNNYTRPLAGLLGTIRRQTLGDAASNKADRASARAIVDRSVALLRENLPERRIDDRVRLLEGILGKMLWVPAVGPGEGPKIDGDLSDACWAKAAVLDDFTERDTLRRSKHQTRGKLLRCGDKLLLAVECRQDGPIWAQSPKDTLTGTHIWRESGIEAFFGPATAEDPPPYAQYVINAFGAFRGFGQAKDNRDGVQVEVKLDTDQGVFVIEAALPLKAGSYDYAACKTLTFNVGRMIYTRDSYESDVIVGWYPIFRTISDPASRSLIFLE